MHIRDEHLHAGETKERMKRFFGKASDAPTPSGQPIVVAPPLTTDATEADDNDNTTLMDIDPPDPVLQPQETLADEFNMLTSSFSRQASNDGEDGDRVPSVISIKIANLFDLKNRGWIPAHERTASRSLNEELQLYELLLYELLDKDAPGEEDMNVEIDPALDSLLHHV